MAELPRLPFGFADPGERNFAVLARQIVTRAEAARRTGFGSALLKVLAAIVVYQLFAGVVFLVIWALGLTLEPAVFVATVTILFVVMAGLGAYFRAESRWTMLTGGSGPWHAMMQSRAFPIRALTFAFFTMPCWALTTVAALSPRRARVDPPVLVVATQLSAALDEPVTVDALASIILPEHGAEILEEAVVLLLWAGVVEMQRRAGQQVLFPLAGRDQLLVALPDGVAGVTFVSELPGPPGSPRPQAGIVHLPEETTGWQSWVREKPLKALALFTAAVVIPTCAWVLIGHWTRQLSVDLEVHTLPVSGVHGVSFDGQRFVLASDSDVQVVGRLDAREEQFCSLLGLRKLWSGRGGMSGARREELVDFQRVDRALLDPSGQYLLVHGSWSCRPDRRRRCATTTDFAVVHVEEGTLFPTNLFKGLGYQAVKGWWDSGRLLAVRGPAAWEVGGGGRRGSDNLAPEVVAVDVMDGSVVSLHRSREQYFAFAGIEEGQKIFLAADRREKNDSRSVRFDLTEYRDFKAVNSFTIAVSGYKPLLRQAQLDATGAFWVLAFEFAPPDLRLELGWKQSLWVVTRDGSSFTEATERENLPMIFLDTFVERRDSIVVFHRDESEPELESYRIEEN